MKILVTADRTPSHELNFKGETIQDLASLLKINHETVIIKKNGEITHPHSKLSEGDKVEFVGIIYGG